MMVIGTACAWFLCTSIAQTFNANAVQGKSMIEVRLKKTSVSARLIVLEVTVKNSGPEVAYIVTDTRRTDGSPGPYIIVDKDDPTMLVCTSQFYPPNPFGPFSDGTSAHITRLDPGQTHAELMRISVPLQTTEPPYTSVPGSRAIPATAIRQLEVRIGVLETSLSLRELIKRKLAPHDAFTGMEQIGIGSTPRALYDLQEVVRSNVVGISLD
jgi:hypothetical protein